MDEELKSAARKIIEYRASPELLARVDYLREGSNQGALTEDEDSEYKQFIEALDVLSVMQAKARKILEENG